MRIGSADAALVAYNSGRSITHQSFYSACYAPFVGMSFDMTGAVSVCGFTRLFSLGRVGEVSLEDMWRGVRVQELRTAVAHDDLGFACSRCAEEIEGGNIHGALSVGFDRFSAERFPLWPTRMEFALSNRCNLQCVMCSGEFSSAIRSRREGLPSLPERYGEAFLEELGPFLDHLDQARFLGGEPFLAEINFRIWEQMLERGLRVDCNVTTNGTCWTPRVERVLEALPFSVGISIDGVSRDTVESIRSGVSYDDVMANLLRFVAYRDRTGASLSLTFCLMVANHHEFVDYLLMAEDLGCQVYVNTVRQPPEHSLYALSTDELRSVVADLDRKGSAARESLVINRSVLDEQFERLSRALAERLALPTVARAEMDDRHRYGELLERCADPKLSESEVISLLSDESADGRVSIVRCDTDDLIGQGDRYLDLDLTEMAGEPASVLLHLLAERFGNGIDVVGARSGGGVSARVLSFRGPVGGATLVLSMTRRGPEPWSTSRFAAMVDRGDRRQDLVPRDVPVEVVVGPDGRR